jgi:hypothetical protein
MKEEDLVAEIYSSMPLWEKLPIDFEEKLFEKYATHSADAVRDALSKARLLSTLVDKSCGFYNEPYNTVRDKIRTYLREELPGLSERTYFAAEKRIMYMYIK